MAARDAARGHALRGCRRERARGGDVARTVRRPCAGLAMIVVVMGVAGSGKTRIGRMLAARLGWPFLDADDFHPASNIAKMASGHPLDDADRVPWLDAMHAKIATMPDAVLACSALKESYRQRLRAGLDVRFVFLRGSRELIAERVRHREHFFAPELIESQFEALEEPADALAIDAALPPEVIVNDLEKTLTTKTQRTQRTRRPL